MHYRFGLIGAPEKAKEKMEPVRNKDTEQGKKVPLQLVQS